MTRRGAHSASDASSRYAGALDWLYGFADAERGIGWNPRSSPSLGWNLRRTRILLDLAGGPDRRMAIVLVAGTKGKGSTAALLASILSASGARTGLYTKPHLQSYRERIRVDGEAVGEAAFADAAESFKPRVEALRSLVPAAGQPTAFELTTAMAFLHFSALGCTTAVVEVGLGGRLDATNATDPHVSVIAPISHDHMRELGTRLDQIAREKAGVIRPGRVVVVAAQRPTVEATIRAESLRVGSELRVAGALSPAEGKRLGLTLRGPHQLQNAALAITAARALSEHGVVTVDDSHFVRGMSRVRWPGRFEILPGPPQIVLDGAHNDGSAQALAVALRQEFRGRPIRLIVGMLRGKDAGAFARATAPLTRHVYVTAARATRALPAEVLARGYRGARVFSALADALASARAEAGARDVICITGSLALVGEARDLLGLPFPARLWDG